MVRGYCDGCVAKSPQAVRERERGSSAKRGYGYRWQQYSKARLRRHPLCVGYPAGVHGERVALATQTDHIEAVKGPADPLFWDAGNHQSLCDGCHSTKTVKEDGGFVGRRK